MRSPIPLSEFAPSTTTPELAVTLPPAAYTSPAFYEFELRAVWDRSWICVGRADEIPEPGDYFTAELAGGERVIVVRTNDHGINVMSEVCQHRGMLVTAPAQRGRDEWFADVPLSRGNTRNFRCPYHWWIYDLTGRLVGAPDMSHRSDFDRASISLPKLAVEVWQGFVFANFDPAAAPLGPTMRKADEILANYHLEDMVSTRHEAIGDMPFNWKLMVENFMEGYHNDRLHHDRYDMSVADNAGSEAITKGHMGFTWDEGEGVLVGAARTAFKDRGLNPTQRGFFPAVGTLTDDERWQMVYMFVPPNLLVGLSTDTAFWFLVHPRGPERLSMEMNYIHPRATKDLKLFDQLFAAQVAGVELFNDEDLPANTATQLGLRSRFAPRGKLAKGDVFLSQFNRWLFSRYQRADALSDGVAVDDPRRSP